MTSNEYLTCIELHSMIKDVVTANVFLTIEDDTLIVHINAGRGVKYDYRYEHISYETDYEKIVSIIESEYKKFILERFFRR